MHDSLRRGLELLELVGQGVGAPAALAEALGVDKSTISRMLRTLGADGWIVQQGAQWGLGPRAVVVGANGPMASLVRRARTLVDVVCDLTGADVAASVLLGGNGYQLAVALADGGITDYPPVVGPFPIWSTATGQMMAAQLDHDTAMALLPHEPFMKSAPNTITTRAQFSARLAALRSRAYAVEIEEYQVGYACVAMAWRPTRSALPAALACVTTVDQMRHRRGLFEQVLSAAAAPGATRASVGRSVAGR